MDLEASCARALDEEVTEQRAECDADKAADQAYDDTFIDYEAAYLEPCRPTALRIPISRVRSKTLMERVLTTPKAETATETPIIA